MQPDYLFAMLAFICAVLLGGLLTLYRLGHFITDIHCMLDIALQQPHPVKVQELRSGGLAPQTMTKRRGRKPRQIELPELGASQAAEGASDLDRRP